MSRTRPTFVQLNGRLLPTARARISALDRGVLYGDGLFETLRVYHGRPFALDEHLTRLRASADFLGIVLPRRQWRREIRALIERNRLQRTDGWVRITVTRGAAAPGLLPPARPRPTLIVSAGPLDRSIADAQRHGARVTLLPFARYSFLAEHKVLDYLPGVLGKVIAVRHHAFEGLYIAAGNEVTEGTTTNVFIVRGRRLLTPPAVRILPGLTRRFVIEIAAAEGLTVKERRLRAQDLLDADEAFVTSSLAEVVPIIAVDARRIGAGRVGLQTRKLQRLYRQMVDRAMDSVQFR